MSSSVSHRSDERIWGFDLIRLASFFAIAFFHISLIHYYERDVPLSDASRIAAVIEVYARSLSFSGFTIAFLSSLLTGLSGSSLKQRMRLFTFLSIGWVVFSLLMNPVYGGFLAWDVYPLIFVGILSATFAERLGPKALRGLGFAGFVMLWLPFWRLSEHFEMSEMWRNVLGFGDCTRSEVAEWPVLPWIGLVWSGYAAGVTVRESRGKEEARLKGSELALWALLLLAGVTTFGAFYSIELGNRFSCVVYRMDPWIFWGHFIWPVFLIRASLDPRVQAWLGQWRLVRAIGRLGISRKFWAAYIFNYLLAHLLSLVANESGLMGTPWETNFTLFLAFIFLPLTELAARSVIWIMRRSAQSRRFAIGLGLGCMALASTLPLTILALKYPEHDYSLTLPNLDQAQTDLALELERDVTKLASEIGPRNAHRHPAELARAADFIESEFVRAGLVVTRQAAPGTLPGEVVHNLIADRPAQDPASPVLVIGAHYDSFSESPGADDNASGVAAMLALARRLGSTSKYALRFVAFANEEPPFFQKPGMGSVVYVDSLADTAKIQGMICLESLGYYRGGAGSQQYPRPMRAFYSDVGDFVGFVGNLASRDLVDSLLTEFRRVSNFPAGGVGLPNLMDGLGWSDQWAFWQRGIPAVMVTDTAVYRYPYYHSRRDLPEHLDFRAMARVVSALTVVLGERDLDL